MAKGEDTPGTEMVLAGEASTFMVLRTPRDEITSLIEETLGGEALKPQDLDRVKVPTGGRTKWDVPNMDGGEDTVEFIEGVVIDSPTRRGMWKDKYTGGNEPPDCFSDDGKIGQGDPGGPCVACPFNEFGTADEGEGKKCKETNQLFVLMEDSLIPIVVTVPPSSLTVFRKFRVGLLRGGASLGRTTVKIGLEKDKSSGGIDYSKLTFRRGTPLDPEAQGMVRAYADLLRPQMDQVMVDADVLGEDPEAAA